MKTIIFIKYSPLTKKVYEDYCFSTLLEVGYSVEYWDISKLYKFHLTSFESYNPQNSLIVRQISNYREMECIIKERLDAIFISMMTCVYNQKKLLKILTKFDVITAYWGPDPVCSQKSSISRRIKRVTIKKLFRVISDYYLHFLLRLNYIHYYKYYFSVGENGFRQLGIYDKNLLSQTVALPINSFDYNKFHYKTNNQKICENGYIVFVDQYLPLHPDNIILGKSNIATDEYYKELNNCFSNIERQLNLKVIIAAHPKALKYKEKDFFNGREVIFNQADNLIKNAKLVLAHYSTAIDYAIMAYKPILLLDAHLFEPSAPQYTEYIMNLSSRLGLNVITLDDCEKEEFDNGIFTLSLRQRERYDSFIQEFCAASQTEECNEVLLPKYLERIMDKL